MDDVDYACAGDDDEVDDHVIGNYVGGGVGHHLDDDGNGKYDVDDILGDLDDAHIDRGGHVQ